MLSFFQRLLAWLTGGPKTATPAATPSAPAAAPAATPAPASFPAPASGTVLVLKRSASGSQLHLGDQVVDCLEDPRSALAAGSYSLALRSDGGLHTAYLFRFPDLHKGMIQIQDPGSRNFRYLRLGEQSEDAQGGLVIAHIGHYLDLYVAITEPLLVGKSVQLQVG